MSVVASGAVERRTAGGLPIVLLGSAVRALVVGGGPVAERKVRALLAAGASVLVVAPRIGEGLRSAAERDPALRLELREADASDCDGSTLVVAATDRRETNAAIAAAARERGLLVNVVDAPDEGNFVTPAVHRSGALTIAVSAGGVPGAAARIRDELALRFDERYARAIETLRRMRRGALDEPGDGGGGWAALSGDLVDAHFCEHVESGELERRAAEWR